MPEDEGSWDKLVRKRAIWLQSFWFVRGVMGTMALVALIPQITELEQIEALRALYAMILGWNDVMAWVGASIAIIPYLPNIPAQTVSTVVFFLAIPFPMLLAMISEMRSGEAYADWPAFAFGSFGILMYGIVMSVGFAVIAHGGSPFAIPVADMDVWQLVVAAILILTNLGVLLAIPIVSLPGYRSGLLFTLGVIATIVIGYNIGTTGFSDWVNTTVCEELRIAPEDCSPERS
ncbi:MAG: hypothetical protein AAF409_15495 [Pseudomonadota bacterium]